MAHQEMLGRVELVMITDPGEFMSPYALDLNLNHMSESWWVSSNGRWCPQHVERQGECEREIDGDNNIDVCTG